MVSKNGGGKEGAESTEGRGPRGGAKGMGEDVGGQKGESKLRPYLPLSQQPPTTPTMFLSYTANSTTTLQAGNSHRGNSKLSNWEQQH